MDMKACLIRFSPKMQVWLWCGVLSFNIFSCKEDPFTVLQSQIDTELATGGTFAVAWKDLQTGESLFINADTYFHAASTMKTPVMIEVYQQSELGNFSLSDSIIVKNQFFSIVDSSVYSLTAADDSDVDLYQQVGQHKAIADLVYDMIIVSSNLATNLVIDLVDARKVTLTMRNLGANKIEVLRGVEDIKAFEAGLSNRTTARDLLIIYEHLAEGNLISSAANREMIAILLDQKFNDIIPAQLPAEVKVAHKTGSITGVHHDSGIVFLPNGDKYVLILLSKDLEDFDQGTESMARVSRYIYDYVTR